ncbi:MarR family winged helix-turn-helix transcriptional regulator [Pseudalkalibacillus salsuginis]|uniref:MarR family winged helix-turn-helix transcriptional regulator n=1 Tax=Pseudalkalibacillus salsuginis TaxID=2910972 RepID=UPI001F2AAB6F|nr:MarR family transcriptional regulator [Pseudalkalibacillus salsuginis]MCF6410759.1 MarR family transcriptional regulator [Pseudalkalibacillus salsuginis]
MEPQDILNLRLNVQRFVRLFGLLERNVTPCGFPLSISQVITLQELEHKKLTLMELTERLFLERSSVSRLVDQLVKEGFINRETNMENRREVLLSLTPIGINTLHRVREQSLSFYDSLLKHISEPDHQKIIEVFQLLNDALSKERSETNG